MLRILLSIGLSSQYLGMPWLEWIEGGKTTIGKNSLELLLFFLEG